MGPIIKTVDAMIAAAEKADHWLHDKLDKLKELREKLTTFASSNVAASDDPLVGELLALGSEAT